MKKAFVFVIFVLITFSSFAQPTSPNGWNQIEIYVSIENLQGNAIVRFKMEATDAVWDFNKRLTNIFDEAYYPKAELEPIDENTNWTTLHTMDWLGFEFANSSNMNPPMDSYGYGRYKFSAQYTDIYGQTREDYFYIDYSDCGYDYLLNYPNLYGHPADMWFKYDANDGSFFYSSVQPQNYNFNQSYFWNSIAENQDLSIWEIKHVDLDGQPTKDCFELYLTLSSQSGHPRLDWNPYHDQSSVQTYYIYKDDGTTPYATTTNLYYIDTQEWIYTPRNPKDYVSYRVAAKLTNGAVSLKGNKESIAINAGVNKDVSNKENEPNEFALFQNHPNPFSKGSGGNPTTVINYTIPQASYVTLKVYNALGKEVVTLVNGAKEAGKHAATFDGSGLPSGVYFYALTAGEFTDTKKLILTK